MNKKDREKDNVDGNSSKPPTPNPKAKKKSKLSEETNPEEKEDQLIENQQIEGHGTETTSRNLLGAIEAAADNDKKKYAYLHQKTKFQDSTQTFDSIPGLITRKLKPFTSLEVYGDGDTIHDHVRSQKAFIKSWKKKAEGYEPTTDDWAELFTHIIKNRNKNEYKSKWPLPIRLCKTSPEVFGIFYDNGKLLENTQTIAWKAANDLLGKKWTLSKTPNKISFSPEILADPKQPNVKPKTTQKNHNPYSKTKAITLTRQPKNTAIKTNNGLFMRKEIPNKKEQKTTALKKKHMTYLKIRFPQVQQEGLDGDKILVEQLNKFLQFTHKLDPGSVLIPWHVDSKAPHISGSEDQPVKNKAKLLNYVNSAFMRVGSYTYCRVKIAHQKGMEIFDEEKFGDLKMTEDIIVSVDPIQAQVPTCVGWLLGAHPRTFNSDEYTTALKAHSLIKGMDMEARVHKFKLEPKWKSDEDEKVVHIYCAKENSRKLKTTMNKIYGSTRKSDSFPLGRNYRFIPFTADPYQPSTQGLKRLAMEAFLQQKNFVSQMTMVETDRIAGLDYYIKPPVDATLREVLMATKASDGNTNLFDSVDTRWSGSVAFLVHQDLEQEAQTFISFLPLILQEKFGPRIWGWFKDWVQAELSGMYWDHKAGKIRSSAEDELAADLADWTGIEDLREDDESDDEMDVRIDLDVQINMEEAREKFQLFDENGSLNTFGQFLPKGDASVYTVDSNDSEEKKPKATGDDDEDSFHSMDVGDDQRTKDNALTDGSTQPSSTLTGDSAEAIAKRLMTDETFKQQVLNKTKEKEASKKGGASENVEND